MTCCAPATVLSATQSVCPRCLRKLDAERILEGDSVYLRKSCPEHGDFKTVIWRGAESYHLWGASAAPLSTPPAATAVTERGCPFDCGLCEDHRQQSCCVLVEVTRRCNLACPVCFAESGGAGSDPTLDQIKALLSDLKAKSGPINIQLSGGEPTLRDDLPDIVAYIHDIGLPFVQLNTNGIRLAKDEAYTQRLKDAGLDCVFLQFDGLDDAVYRTIRGADLLDVKLAAIERCAHLKLGVVLVPVLVPGVNTHQIGDIVRFAARRSPAIRTVHFQPISYFGRHPACPTDRDRFTIPDVLRAIEDQTGGMVSTADFKPGTAENPYCSFNGDFLVGNDGTLTPSRETPSSSCCGGAKDKADGAAEQARRFVAQRWAAPDGAGEAVPDTSPLMKIDALVAFLESRKRTLCISGMVFQDAWTLDLDRLRQCYIHIATADRRLVPLCAFNLTTTGGEALYRGGAA